MRDAGSALIDPAARLGTGVRVGALAIVGAEVRLGDGAVVDPGARLLGPVSVGEGAHIGAGATLAAEPGRAIAIGAGARVGAGSTIDAGVTVGSGARVEPGAVVLRAIPSNAIARGNPASVVGFVEAPGAFAGTSKGLPAKIEPAGVGEVTIHHFPVVIDARGKLSVGEFERDLPFRPMRYFIVYDVPSLETRGEHAHRECHEFLVCVRGRCAVVVDDGTTRREIALERPDMGVNLPAMTWRLQYKFSADAILLVFASHYYDAGDYIRDYAQYRSLVGTL